jgi:hypothetical protein
LIQVEQEPLTLKKNDRRAEEEQRGRKNMQVLEDEQSRYLYLPHRSNDKKIFYGSEHLYCLTRFLYAIYERLIKMR